MVQVYNHHWQRGKLGSFFSYWRDFFILVLPVRSLPRFLVRWLYGFEPQFVFLCHPRAYQDIFIAAPFLKPIQFFFRKKNAYDFLLHVSPFVLNAIRTKYGVNGLVIGQVTFPEILFKKRKSSIAVMKKSILLASKICKPGTILGLGGWLPMISKRGASLKKYAHSRGIILTNGHCGTSLSIYLTIEHIAQKANIGMRELRVAIIGAGKMGMNLIRILNGKVNHLTIIDIQPANFLRIRNEIIKNPLGTTFDTVLSSALAQDSLREALKLSHIGVCSTSSLRTILRLKDMPEGFIAIDDSRPEALPRDPKNERIILEGGLLKIPGTKTDYNYGFGEDDNVFGCLGEAFLLALDKENILVPTLGDVDLVNFWKMVEFCKRKNVSQGDLKSCDVIITEADIQHAFEKRGFFIGVKNEKG